MSRRFQRLKRRLHNQLGITLSDNYNSTRAGKHQRKNGMSRWHSNLDFDEGPFIYEDGSYLGFSSQYTVAYLLDAHCLKLVQNTNDCELLDVVPCDHEKCKHLDAKYNGHANNRNFWKCSDCNRTITKPKGWKPKSKIEILVGKKKNSMSLDKYFK
ncbi:hypothetical protein LCGC14_0176150 [marine sediment metagenome]|uniref:Uncharacterized protein n=1 Tax=marine sediment metagenome TaxID=412755 RepID=A0A0F9X9T2_9ZZZZ